VGDQERKLVDTATAVQRHIKLRGEMCCSEPWVEALIVSAGNDQWETRLFLYPPGGKDTAMRECPACRRVCPPNGPQGSPSPCCDCEVEESEEVFGRREEKFVREAKDHREGRERIHELRRRWWRRSMSYKAFMGNLEAGPAGEGESAPLGEISDSPTKAGAWPGFVEVCEGAALYLENEEAAPRRRSNGRPESIETAVRWLRQAQKGEDTCPRCNILLREPDKEDGVCPECEAPLTGTCPKCLTRLRRPMEERATCPRCGCRVRGPRRKSGKDSGCCIELLSEAESTLQKEIKHFREKLQAVEERWGAMSRKERESSTYFAMFRSARRINTPYLKEGLREDYLSVSGKFAGFRRSKELLRDVEDWLTDILADGPVARDGIRRMAEEAGAAWATVRSAKKRIGATQYRGSLHGEEIVLWRLFVNEAEN